MKRTMAVMLALVLALCMVLAAGCGRDTGAGPEAENADGADNSSGEIVILFTSDIHCGVDKGWGFAGLRQIRDTLEAGGTPVLLVDNGDAIQGEPIGALSKGKAVADLMNKVGYDAAIPGNHEFDFGMENFLEIAGNAEFPYISCNLRKGSEPLLDPYVILEAGGKRIAFVGVTTPETIATSDPRAFQDENGNYIYDFMQKDATGQEFYDAIQHNVDAARAEGADYVILLGHLGMEANLAPWDYASVAANTDGIDAILDGHSHDYEQVRVANKSGRFIPRGGCGTKMKCIGWARISTEDGKVTTGLYDWNNDVNATELLGIDNEVSLAVADTMAEVDEQLSVAVGSTPFDLTIHDPTAKDSNGEPVLIVRNAETNLGDLITDAFRDQAGTDFAIMQAGSIRTSIPAGEITVRDILTVLPFNKELCVAEVTGQQILDALEFGVSRMPNQFGGFLQVSGLTYEIDTSVPSGCSTDDNGMFAGVSGERRVKNVMAGDRPIDPDKVYTLAGDGYTLKDQGNGMAMFGEEYVTIDAMMDHEALMNYIRDTLGGTVSEEYADPYGQGRITAIE